MQPKEEICPTFEAVGAFAEFHITLKNMLDTVLQQVKLLVRVHLFIEWQCYSAD